MSEQPENNKTWVDEVEVAVNEVFDRVKELVEEGNVRRIIIRKSNGEVVADLSLAAGAMIGGALVFFAPVVAALAALGGLVANLKLEIVREGNAKIEPSSTGKSKIQINVETED